MRESGHPDLAAVRWPDDWIPAFEGMTNGLRGANSFSFRRLKS
jgi:hypothetical protein